MLPGGAGDDLLIGGSISFHANLNALAAIMGDWTRTVIGYIDRINRLRGTVVGGLNGSILLTLTTVRDDPVADDITGAGGLDWFWTAIRDTTDLEAGELIG